VPGICLIPVVRFQLVQLEVISHRIYCAGPIYGHCSYFETVICRIGVHLELHRPLACHRPLTGCSCKQGVSARRMPAALELPPRLVALTLDQGPQRWDQGSPPPLQLQGLTQLTTLTLRNFR